MVNLRQQKRLAASVAGVGKRKSKFRVLVNVETLWKIVGACLVRRSDRSFYADRGVLWNLSTSGGGKVVALCGYNDLENWDMLFPKWTLVVDSEADGDSVVRSATGRTPADPLS